MLDFSQKEKCKISKNIIWRFYLKSYEPLWEFIDQKVSKHIVRKDGRGFEGTGFFSDTPSGWSMVLVFDDQSAYDTTKSWVEKNQDVLGYAERIEDLPGDPRENDEIEEAKPLEKTLVKYRPSTGAKQCRNCNYFIADLIGDGCEFVEEPIQSFHVCNMWYRRSP